MGVFTFTDEHTSSVPLARLFKALIVDSHKLIPRLWPQAIRNIDILQGNGGPRTIKQINFVEGSQLGNMKNRVDKLNEETFVYKHTMINLKEKFESIAYEVKFEPTSDGGSKNKMTSMYYTKGNVELKEEDIKAGKREPWECTRLLKRTFSKIPTPMLEKNFKRSVNGFGTLSLNKRTWYIVSCLKAVTGFFM